MAATKHLYNIFEWSREIKKVGKHWLKQTSSEGWLSRLHTATFSSGTTTIFFTKFNCFDDFGKIQHKFLTKPSKVLNRFLCYINIHFITNRRGTISNIAKFPGWSFHFQLSSFSTNALRVSIKSKIVLPLPCTSSFRLTLLSCWNTSARYAKLQMKWLFSRLDIIPLFPWSQRIDFNCYGTSGCVHLRVAHCI